MGSNILIEMKDKKWLELKSTLESNAFGFQEAHLVDFNGMYFLVEVKDGSGVEDEVKIIPNGKSLFDVYRNSPTEFGDFYGTIQL